MHDDILSNHRSRNGSPLYLSIKMYFLKLLLSYTCRLGDEERWGEAIGPSVESCKPPPRMLSHVDVKEERKKERKIG